MCFSSEAQNLNRCIILKGLEKGQKANFWDELIDAQGSGLNGWM